MEDFKFGIKFKEQNNITIKESLEKTSIHRFTTSNDGLEKVACGELITMPIGSSDGWHAVLVEGYEYDTNCFIGKNS